MRKNLDVIVLNDVSNDAIGFDSPENAVTVIHDGGETVFSQAPKDAIATAVMDTVADLYVARTVKAVLSLPPSRRPRHRSGAGSWPPSEKSEDAFLDSPARGE